MTMQRLTTEGLKMAALLLGSLASMFVLGAASAKKISRWTRVWFPGLFSAAFRLVRRWRVVSENANAEQYSLSC